jgi:cephalosporin hydroxylase
MSEHEKFKREGAAEIARMGDDVELAHATRSWMDRANRSKYSYHFEWMGRPIIQYPQDILAVQEIIWSVKPDLIIETDIRAHNRAAIEAHPMMRRIAMIEGSSVAPEVISQVRTKAAGKRSVLVLLDSNHTHDHVLTELEAYAGLATVGSYCIAFDTVIEDMPDDAFDDRSWGKGNNAKTAVWDYLKRHSEFEIDKNIQNKLLITVAPDGYLKRVK